MATVTRENIGLLHDKLTVNITPADYKKSYDASLKKYAENANIPGFRKGKVPTSVLAKMYGEKIIVDEVLRLSEKSVDEYIKSEKIDTFFYPIPVFSKFEKVDVNNPKEFSFDFEIGLRPTIDFKPEEVKATRYVIQVTDDLINQQIAALQDQFGEQIERETVTSDEDLLNITFDEVDADGNVIVDGISKATRVNVKHFTEEKIKSLYGLKVNDGITVTLAEAFPENVIGSVLEDLGLNKEDNESAEKTFKISITKIGFQKKAELGEDFFSKVYTTKEIKSEEELRAAVLEEIQTYFAIESSKQLHDQIYHHLIDNVPVELPQEFVLKAIEIGGEKKKTREEAIEEYPKFAQQLKWSLITAQLRVSENISVENEDYLNTAKAQILQYFGGQMNFGTDDSWLTEMAEKTSTQKKFREEAYSKIFADKLFSALEQKITPSEESIDLESFSSKVHHHHF